MKLIETNNSFRVEIEARNSTPMPITEEIWKKAMSKVPLSFKNSVSRSQDKVTCYSREICCGHNSVEIARRGSFLIFITSYSTSNNSKKTIYQIFGN